MEKTYVFENTEERVTLTVLASGKVDYCLVNADIRDKTEKIQKHLDSLASALSEVYRAGREYGFFKLMIAPL